MTAPKDDKAIFVQKNAAGKYVAQEGYLLTRDRRPNPEKATPEEQYDTLPELISGEGERASKTEHGFRLILASLMPVMVVGQSR